MFSIFLAFLIGDTDVYCEGFLPQWTFDLGSDILLCEVIIVKNRINMPRFLKKYLFARFLRNVILALIALLCIVGTILIMNPRILPAGHWIRPLPTSAYWFEIALVNAESTLVRQEGLFRLVLFVLPFAILLLFFVCRVVLLLQNLRCLPSSKMYRILKQYGDPDLLLHEFDSSLDQREKSAVKRCLLKKRIYIGGNFVVAPYPTYLYIAPTV